MKLSRNLVNASLEILLESKHETYVAKSNDGNRVSFNIANQIIPECEEDGIKTFSTRAVVQALFESDFLSTTDEDFHFDQLLKYILGVKMHEAIDTFKQLHSLLMENEFTNPLDNDKRYNSSGDNYYSAVSFKYPVDETGSKRDVIFIENQSPAWAIVLVYNKHTKEPDSLHFVQLRKEYDDPCKYQEVIDTEASFVVGYNFEWCGLSDATARIVASLNIDRMECTAGWWEPKKIEHTLFNLYCGLTAIQIDNP